MSQAILVGVLDDLADGPPSPNDVATWVELAVAELTEVGRIDSPVEVIHAHGLGLPFGTAQAVERAFEHLVSEGARLIVGPAIGDNALVATPLAERARIPTINWAGSERARATTCSTCKLVPTRTSQL